MPEQSLDEMRSEMLEAVTDVMETSSTVFAALLAFLLQSRALDRAQVEETLHAAEEALAAGSSGTSGLGEKFIPQLRARLEAILEQLDRA
jgi:hypothetical protein